MSLRSFTVFQDTPASDTPKPKPLISSRISRSSASNAENSCNATLQLPIDKENVHPVTGERAGPSSAAALKKRKTTVLATKVHMPLATKSLKEPKVKEKLEKDCQPLAKKRKPSSAGSKPASIAKKDTKSATTTRKPLKRSSRGKIASLPKLDEEAEGENEKEKDMKLKDNGHVAQVTIDSKCYELTVKPLADVSGAYEKTSPVEVEDVFSEKVKLGLIKERVTEPGIRDYFSPSLTASTTRARSTSQEPTSEARAFSTPERKQIYAAFTFSSPSPIGKRFKPIPITPCDVAATGDHL